LYILAWLVYRCTLGYFETFAKTVVGGMAMKKLFRGLIALACLGLCIALSGLGRWYFRDNTPIEVKAARQANAAALVRVVRLAYGNAEKRAQYKIEEREGMIFVPLDENNVEYVLVSLPEAPFEVQLSPNRMDIYDDENGDGRLDRCDCAAGREETQELYEEYVGRALQKFGLNPVPIPVPVAGTGETN
jgi:hypothetical protein